MMDDKVSTGEFWDFSRCPRWYVPVALFWRSLARTTCWASSRHAIVSHWSLRGLHETSHQTCYCGTFGAVVDWQQEKEALR